MMYAISMVAELMLCY